MCPDHQLRPDKMGAWAVDPAVLPCPNQKPLQPMVVVWVRETGWLGTVWSLAGVGSISLTPAS